MSKIVLNDVTNLNTLSVINDNFDKIEQELQNKVMYRDNPAGEPNTLEDDVDANGNSIYNVENLTIAGSFTVDGQDVGAYIGQAQEAADEAVQSATAAANSSASAAASSSNAASSAATATAQATIATTKANEASSSASSASSSATTSITQASVATTQAGIATTQAGIATTQASNAATSASQASTFATNSSNSAVASANSAAASDASATASAASASSSAASAAAAAAALDNFDDRYLGPKTSDPTVDNDGNPLITGALYYRTTTPAGMRVWDGAQWLAASAASQASLVTYEYIATAGQTTFTGNDTNNVPLSYTVGGVVVTINGVVQNPGEDYTASNGVSIVLAAPASFNDEIVVLAFRTFEVANTYTQGQADGRFVRYDTASQGLNATQQANARANINAQAALGFTPADANATVNLSGDQTINGTKTFVNGVRFNDGTTQSTASSPGIGTGQSWQSVSRANATTYTNSTGRTIAVFVVINNAPSNGITQLFVNGSFMGQLNNYGSVGGGMFLVPPGATYSINTSGSSLSSWYELR